MEFTVFTNHLLFTLQILTHVPMFHSLIFKFKYILLPQVHSQTFTFNQTVKIIFQTVCQTLTKVFSTPNIHHDVILPEPLEPGLLYHKQTSSYHWRPGKHNTLSCKLICAHVNVEILHFEILQKYFQLKYLLLACIYVGLTDMNEIKTIK